MTATDDELMTQLPRETPMTDWKALCVELLAALKNAIRVVYHEDGTEHISTADPVIAKADAALTSDGPAVPESREPASVMGEPSDIEQVAQQVFEAMRFSGATSPAPPEWVSGGNSLMQDHARDVARAVLARWGQPSAPPVPPLKERPDFIAGYREGLADGRRIAEDEETEQQGEGPTLEEVEELLNRFAAFNIECLQGLINDALARWGHQPAPLVAGAPGPSMEDVGPLIAWLTEQACQAADASQPADAGMLTWAAQVIGERVNEDAPVAGEVAELVAWIHQQAVHRPDAAEWRRAAELLQQQQAKIESLEQQLEAERMRVVACGIIATSDTPFSAAKNRNCHPDYWSASADDIARQIDELMRLRAQQTPVPEAPRYEFSVYDADCMEQAGGSAPSYAQALSEGQRYLAQYQQDGPHALELRRVEVLHPGALPLPQGEVE